MKKRILNDNESTLIIDLFSKGVSVTEIYSRTGISPKIVKKLLLSENFKVRSHRIHNINEATFTDINTQEKAYWLGFLYADGSARKIESKGHYEVRLWLSTKDEDHLVKFKNFLQSEHPIKYRTCKVKYKNSFTVSYGVGIDICSKQIVNDLFELGCIENKTFRIDAPKIKEEFFRHFIRGYFDGDGCISMKKNNVGKVIKFDSCSEKILIWIKDIFKLYDVSFCELHKEKNHYKLYNSKINDLNKIYDFMYTDATIYLNRKEKKFKEIIEYFNPKKVIQKNINGSVEKMWDDVIIASCHLHIQKSLILRCCDKKLNTAGGYKWEYHD